MFAVAEALIVGDIVLRLLMREGPSDGFQDTSQADRDGESDPLLSTSSETQAISDTMEPTEEHFNSAENTPEVVAFGMYKALQWNWLASVIATTVAVLVRCGLEAVRASHIVLFLAREPNAYMSTDSPSLCHEAILLVSIGIWRYNICVADPNSAWARHC